MEKSSTFRRNFAIIRLLAAVIAAVVLLAVTGFAAVDILSGPTEVDSGSVLVSDDYVEIDVAYIMDVFAVETDDGSGETVAYYAAVPVGDRFVTVRFPAAQKEAVLDLESATSDFLNGRETTMSFHILTTGQTAEISEDVQTIFQQWYENNKTWMSQSGVINAGTDETQILSSVVLQADCAGNVSYSAAIGLSIAAAVLILYAMVELILLLCGVYTRKGGKKRTADGNG